MLPLRLIGSSPAGQETDGSEAMVAPERAVLSTLRRDSWDMAATQSVPKKRLEGAGNFSARRWVFRHP